MTDSPIADVARVRGLLIAAAREGRAMSYSELLGELGHRFTRPKMRALCKTLDVIDEAAITAASPSWRCWWYANRIGCRERAGGAARGCSCWNMTGHGRGRERRSWCASSSNWRSTIGGIGSAAARPRRRTSLARGRPRFR